MRGLWHTIVGCPVEDLTSTKTTLRCKCGAHWWRDVNTGKWIDHEEKDYREYRCMG